MKYILSFAASEFVNFRKVEFDSLVQLVSSTYSTVFSHDDWSKPYVVVEMASDEEISKVVQRSILIKEVYHLWCDANCLTDLLFKISQLPDELVDPFLNSSETFKLQLSTAHKKMHQDEKNPIMESVLNAHKRIESPVSLRSPIHQLNILLEYSPKNLGKGSMGSGGKLCHLYYGRLIGSGVRKNVMNNYRLSERTHLGNTTMDVRLAGIMANVGLCQKSSMIWDPFIGTGSTVLAASIWGAFGAGSDIDYALLHGMGMSPKAGQGKRCGETLHSNYKQYKLESRYLDVVVADATTLHRLLRIPNAGLFDAVVTDPPYGFRERSCRVANQPKEREPTLVTRSRLAEIMGQTHISIDGDKEPNNEPLVQVPHDLPHFPHKETYPVNETYRNLLELSVYLLKPGGRLIFWIPILRSEFDGMNSFPHHPRLRFLAACEQVLNFRNSRYMIVMCKLDEQEPDEIRHPNNEQLIYSAIYSKYV